MNSGNTYRFRPDGSHAEYITHGQVNPFGLAFDPLGNMYSSDCHSRPVYQLLKGAWYPEASASRTTAWVSAPRWSPGTTTARRASPVHQLLCRRPVPRGVSRPGLHRQRRHQPDQRRPDRVARVDPQGHRATRLRLERGQLVPARRHRARSRRRTLRRRLLQPDHRPLRGPPDPPRPRPASRADLAHRLPGRGWQAVPLPRLDDRSKSPVRIAGQRPDRRPRPRRTWPCASRRPTSSSSMRDGARMSSRLDPLDHARCRSPLRSPARQARIHGLWVLQRLGLASSTRRRSWQELRDRSAP